MVSFSRIWKHMENLFNGEKEKAFYVWVRPKDIYANFNANMVGSFVSVANKEDNLMFLPNKNFSGYISPFQGNLLRQYLAEYKLEVSRKNHYPEYPSRLSSTFLFEDEEQAKVYANTHQFHVGDRELLKGKTVGPYTYSRHDLGWIDFLRSPLLIDEKIITQICHSYWKGEHTDTFRLELMEKSISAVATSIFEILFIGRIDFEK